MDGNSAAQSMNMAYRGTPLPLLVAAQSFVSPEVSTMEEIATPNMPEEINMNVQRFWFLLIKELVRNWDSIVDAVQQCISWVREVLFHL